MSGINSGMMSSKNELTDLDLENAHIYWHDTGFDDGYQVGYEDGYQVDYDDGRETATAELSEDGHE